MIPDIKKAAFQKRPDIRYNPSYLFLGVPCLLGVTFTQGVRTLLLSRRYRVVDTSEWTELWTRAVKWIRIRSNTHSFGSVDPDPEVLNEGKSRV